jgi:two-component sensor histidine kinase
MSAFNAAVDAARPVVSNMTAEANHRIANNLESVAYFIRTELRQADQEQYSSSRNVRLLLEQLSFKIDSVSRLHRLLSMSESENQVEISSYLKEVALAAARFMASAHQRISIERLEANMTMPASAASQIGMLVSEAIVNALKYAYALGQKGEITIGSKIVDDILVIEISDTGGGFKCGGIGGDNLRGTGLRLMKGIASQLGGTLDIHSAEAGVVVRLRVSAGCSGPIGRQSSTAA